VEEGPTEVVDGPAEVVREGATVVAAPFTHPPPTTALSAPRTEVLVLADVSTEVVAEEMLAGLPEETPVVEVVAGVCPS